MAGPRKSSRARTPKRAAKRPQLIDLVTQAVLRMRQGEAISIAGKDGKKITVLAVETASEAARKALGPDLSLVLTHRRAQTLKIRLYTPDVVALPVDKKAKVAQLRAIADPTADLSSPLKGPFEAERKPLPKSFAAAVKLAKFAELLPAVIVRIGGKGTFEIPADAIFNYDAEVVRNLAIVTRARVPLEGAEKTELVAFRSGDGGPEHYAIIINAPPTSEPVLMRLHSECFTGDLLHSLKCDCGDQLRGAIEIISKSGGGMVLYLAQEGRGIGLINKLRAYRLQDQGFDTVEANERLGFAADERLYGTAAKMLSLLGYKSIRLLTNNPEKVAQLQHEGVIVVERVPHAFADNEHSRGYLQTKAKKSGHYL